MPTHIHEVPCTIFKTWFDWFLDSLDFDHTLIDTIVFMNAEVKTEELSTIPDMTMSVIIGNPHRPLKEVIPVLIETAFSQQTNPLMNKIRKQICAKPEVLMVIATLIGETKPYYSPEHSSTAWDTLLQETPAHELSSFLDLQPLDSRPTDPITIAGHPWLGLQTIDVWVWVRGDSPININLVTGPRTAHGRLYPDPHMDTVNTIINQGITAHSRYLAWHAKSARGVKHIEHPDSHDNEPSFSNTRSHTDTGPNATVSNNSVQPGTSSAQNDDVQHNAGKSKSKLRGKHRGTKGKGKGKGK
ncbi:hypothetical protein C8R48DRAFT_770374 [Suillus tomentosus]|nr:hypothetical protein C8R48DRAFT_770374 [Suillus tomentosus]